MENKKVTVKTDWNTEDMPSRHAEYTIKRHFTRLQMECLRFGHIPQEMEDKWFWYMEGQKLYAHRSWTGLCIYILTFDEANDTIKVLSNRDPKQYSCTNDAEDAEILNNLLDWWSQENYDYYSEWLSETADAINRHENAADEEVQRSNIYLNLGDITALDIDCIVNAANESLLGGGGVDGAIHRAAGPELLAECITLNGCNTGEAKLTKGYNLKAKWIIHTVGPIYFGRSQDAVLLSNCYRNSLDLAKRNGIRSIAFPGISTGVYGYPKEDAANVATATVNKWINDNKDYVIDVVFCCFDRESFDIYQKILGEKQ